MRRNSLGQPSNLVIYDITVSHRGSLMGRKKVESHFRVINLLVLL